MIAFQSNHDSDVHLTVVNDGEDIEVAIRDASCDDSKAVYLSAEDIDYLIAELEVRTGKARAK